MTLALVTLALTALNVTLTAWGLWLRNKDDDKAPGDCTTTAVGFAPSVAVLPIREPMRDLEP